jgi:ketosteroid isomerase-like protein
MKRLLVVCVLLAVAASVVAAKDKTKAMSGNDVSQTISSLETQWAADSKAGNADGISPILADDVVIIDSDGTSHSKSEALDRVKKAKWETNEISDMKVTGHGNTAIVTGVWTGKGTDDKGKAIDTKERWADTWMKMPSGKWQCIASSSATMMP